MSKICSCLIIGRLLVLRSDWPSHLTLYTDSLGTVAAVHYHKYCHNWRRGCKLVQYYGYFTNGNLDGLHYNDDWNTLSYLVSSQETAFEISFLEKFDAEILIGQVLYTQKADIYNYYNEYKDTKKQCSQGISESKMGRLVAMPNCTILYTILCLYL